MTDNSHSGDDRFNVTEKPEPWSWNQRPGIKASQPKKDFQNNSAEAIRQAIGKRASRL